MKISIITPVFNRERNIALTYEALKKQSFQDFEWIIVDDGSTDKTKEIVLELQKESPFPIKYHYIGKNNGYHQCKARNQGARLADKSSVAYMFLDSDVLLYPDVMEKYSKAYDDNFNRVVCGMYWWGSPMSITREDVQRRWGNIIEESLAPIENAKPHGMIGKDIRENSFIESEQDQLRWDEGTYLACFGGNLLVPKKIFTDVAKYNMKYNPELNRDEFCGYDEHYDAPVEDGDFGLNLRDTKWPVTLHNGINGYHVWHPRNIQEIIDKSKENIVYLDKKHKLNVQEETDKVHEQDWKIK